MKLFAQILQIDSTDNPALICTICLSELSKAMHFRNKAIRAEKYFKRTSEIKGEDDSAKDYTGFEPEIHIKTEDEDFSKIKSEPFDEDPNYELMHNIDLMMGKVPGSSFVDVKLGRDYLDFDEFGDQSKNAMNFYRNEEEFGSASGLVCCKLCLKSFTSMSSHQNHMKTVHRELTESEMHKCKYCNRYFKLKIYLNRHVQRIHGSKHRHSKSKTKHCDTIFNRDDVSLYCEVCK